ncbi:hypothetical protein GR160_04630 [Flavobacterium sp. Sd200]|uniref:hypothetical protein n=1 Tax=Flavobacterium sp. Sd200 TaxID=2692211 RepID=UPI001370B49F|nr:hypothetical protein [Flavobacterium sp. Sd200]MXN90505.1 hypothetical protein [Flavobacterium sp. Sd200]
MFADFFNSISDYAKTRFTNPLLGTIVAVWFIRNFDFVFALFNFADGVTLTQKVDYFHRYFKVHGTTTELCTVIMYAFFILLGTFLLLLFSRGLTNGYIVLLNLVNKSTDVGTVVSRSMYDELRKTYNTVKSERDTLRSKETSHDEALKILKLEIESKEKQYSELNDEFSKKTAESDLIYEELSAKHISLDESHNKLKSELQYKTNEADKFQAKYLLNKIQDSEVIKEIFTADSIEIHLNQYKSSQVEIGITELEKIEPALRLLLQENEIKNFIEISLLAENFRYFPSELADYQLVVKLRDFKLLLTEANMKVVNNKVNTKDLDLSDLGEHVSKIFKIMLLK